MKKRFLVLALSLVLLTGCQLLQGGGGGASSTSSALSIQFVPGAPPTTVYDTDQLSIQLQLFNRGEFEVGGPGDRIYVHGPDPNEVTGIPLGGQAIPAIPGVDQFNTAGGSDFVTFDNIVVRRTADESTTYTLQAVACYEYQTSAAATVCLDPQPHQATIGQRVCNPQAVVIGSHNAPVRVTNILAEPQRGSTLFTITVSHAGPGTPFKPGVSYLNRCSPQSAQPLDARDFPYVQVASVRVGGIDVSCSRIDNEGLLRLQGNAGTFTCRAPVSGNSEYSTQMEIDLRYGYTQQVSMPLTVRRLGP